MTPQQIKDNAPDGATHYIKTEQKIYYFKYGCLGLMYHMRGGWWASANTDVIPFIKPL